ncbi:MAG: type II toxin-antitoxin system HipA family toxin [Planctomycetota bacterium]|nr:type II toxin-antitoxin system HipA family toxin [Planctomycetota bacterium]
MGQLAQHEGRAYFEYSPEFLRTKLEPSPLRLPARPGLIEHRDHEYGDIPGLFADSLPDGWGLLLMDRHLRRQGKDPAKLTPLDRLTYLGRRTMGALTYHPPADAEHDPITLDLQRLADAARKVLSGHGAEALPELLRAGGSPGGARPKVLVGVRGEELLSGEDDLPGGFEHWLVKFNVKDDGADGGRVELAYAHMAMRAGITMPPVRLFETDKRGAFFGVRRFDRLPGNRRVHAHTLGGLLQANFRIPSCDYDHLFKVARRLTHDHRALVECFRRMVFNVAAHNRDDHVKNFAFLLDDGGAWSLSPAYDVTLSVGPGGQHQMSVDGDGEAPTRARCLALGERHGLGRKEAEEVVEQVNEAVSAWRALARAVGCRAARVREVARHHRPL